MINLKKTLYCLLLLLFAGCSSSETHETIRKTKHINIETEIIVKHIPGNDTFKIVTIGGCEYIVYREVVYQVRGGSIGGAGGICHHENCKYCAKRALP